MSEPIANNNTKYLDSTINIEGVEYSVIAAKVEKKLTIKTMESGEEHEVTFDGSEDVEVSTGDANKVKVNNVFGVDGANNDKIYGAITIKATGPTGGNPGDIWFKY